LFVVWMAAAAADEPAVFTLDSVLLPPIGGAAPGLDLTVFDDALRDTFGARFVTVGLDEVDPVDGVSAPNYLTSCPAGARDGCVYVLAARAAVEWAVSAELATGAVGPEVVVAFLDVRRDEVAFRLTLPIDDATGPAPLAQALATTLGWVLEGGASRADVRERGPTAKEAWSDQRDAAAALAVDLVGIEEELGAMLEVGGRASGPRAITVDDLSRFVGEDDAVTPWDRVGMDEQTWVRFQNSGLELDAYRLRARGRAGAVVLRLGGSAGATPFGQRFEGWVVHDAATLDPVGTVALRERAFLLGPGGAFEVAYGLGAQVEVGARVAGALGFQRTDVLREYLGDVAPLSLGIEQESAFNAEVGVRAAWVGSPASRVRPVVGLSFGRWFGSPVERARDLPDELPAPTGLGAFVARPDGGIEVEARGRLDVWVRAAVPIALGGSVEAASGTSSALGGPQPVGAPAVGVEASVGAQLRLGRAPEAPDGVDEEF
jgi:hypothetical protein